MPNVNEYDKQDDWMGACMPAMLGEGRDKDQAAAACASMWKEKKSFGDMSIEEAVKHFLKYGARHSGKDQQALQAAHDALVNVGAMCQAPKSIGDDAFINFGDEVKATQLANGDVKLGGYLIRYGNPAKTDLTGDYFTKSTDFGEAEKSDGWFNHRLPVEFDGKRARYTDQLPDVKLTKDDIGVFAEIVLGARNEYEKKMAEWGFAGKLGWSSGTAPHLVDRKAVGKANEITRWKLGLDASLTPTPAEYRNTVMPIKSWITSEAAATDNDEIQQQETKSKESIMDKEEMKALFDEQKTSISELVKNEATAAATKAVADVLDKLPEVKAKMNATVEVVVAEEDQPFKSDGEFYMSVKNAAIAPHAIDPRLKSLKATGLSEAQPSQAGFLVPQQTAPGIIEKMYTTGSLLSVMSNRDPVIGYGMSYNLVDETSRADGSRNGGVTGYWGAEGGTKTASKGKFRQLELKLKKVYALCVATDELLEDAPTLGNWLNRVAPDELRFKVEDAIVNGDGVGKPAGILTSPAFKSAVRTDANEIDALDIGRMWAARFVGVNDYIWLGNQSIFPQLLTLTIGNMPVYIPAGGLGGLPYSTLLGRPYYDTEYNPVLGTLGDLMLVSPSQYQMIDKGGVQVASSIHVYFTTDESAFRFVYRIDGAPTWNSTLTLKDTNTVSPYVGLAATT
jgi:HK97 family phage major capsid protein